MYFTIITPSYNQLDYLKRCVASVADQVVEGDGRESFPTVSIFSRKLSVATLAGALGVGENDLKPNTPNLKHRIGEPIFVHHHIQDGGSSDGTVDWLHQYASEVRERKSEDRDPSAECLVPSASSFSFSSEKDEGMYDAINKGIALVGTGRQALGTRGETCSETEAPQRPPPNAQRLGPDSVVAWLNCDEQYLPGTLEKVSVFFGENPDTDILFGGMLVVDPQGQLISCRKAMPMRRLFLEASYLYNYSCAMFVRVSFWKKLGGFDTDFKNAGDEELIRRAMKLNAKCCMLKSYLSVFTYSDTNLSSDPAAVQEHEALKRSSSMVSRIFKLPINLMRLIEKGLRGGHVQKTPIEYEIYAENITDRTKFVCNNPSCKWPGANKPYLLSHRLKGC